MKGILSNHKGPVNDFPTVQVTLDKIPMKIK